MGYRLKTASMSDVDEIWEIIEKTIIHSFPDEQCRKEGLDIFNITHSARKIELEIQNNYQHYIVALENEQIVAFASYSHLGTHTPDCKIHKVLSDPSAGKRNYNKILIEHIGGLAKHRGIKRLVLNSVESRNINYFESLGFAMADMLQTKKQGLQGVQMFKSI